MLDMETQVRSLLSEQVRHAIINAALATTNKQAQIAAV